MLVAAVDAAGIGADSGSDVTNTVSVAAACRIAGLDATTGVGTTVAATTGAGSAGMAGSVGCRLRGDASLVSDWLSDGAGSPSTTGGIGSRAAGTVATAIGSIAVRRTRPFAGAGCRVDVGVAVVTSSAAGSVGASSTGTGSASVIAIAIDAAMAGGATIDAGVIVGTAGAGGTKIDAGVSLGADEDGLPGVTGAVATIRRVGIGAVASVGRAGISAAMIVGIVASAVTPRTTVVVGRAATVVGVMIGSLGIAASITPSGRSPTSAAMSGGKLLPVAASPGRGGTISITLGTASAGGVPTAAPPARSASASAKSLVVVIGEPLARVGLSSDDSDRVVG